MRPLGKRVLVSVNLNQKRDYEIELSNGITLWMDSDFGADRRITQPSIAVVHGINEHAEGMKVGDVVLCHHNSFGRTTGNTLFGDTGTKTESGEAIFTLETSMIYVRLDKDGNPFPLPGFLIVERIEEKIDTFLEVPDSAKKNYKDRVKVLKVHPQDSEDFKEGDTVICFDKSDYEIVFTFNKKPVRVIRVRTSDVIGKLVEHEESNSN